MENPPQQRYGLEWVRPREQDLGNRDCRNSHRLCIRTAATHHIRSILLPLAKYRLAEQALASGQQLPENFFKEAAATDIRSKGINNIFVGIGLFIFLWAITGEFGLGCIGLLVMFTGFGQLVIFYSQQKKNEEK